MTEAEKRFDEAIRAVVCMASNAGINAGTISGALIVIAAETSAQAVGLGVGHARPLAEGAVEGMRNAVTRIANAQVRS